MTESIWRQQNSPQCPWFCVSLSLHSIVISYNDEKPLINSLFRFLGILFTTLAEPATLTAPIPASDHDKWQQLFLEIFEKDMEQFRDYCANEEVCDSVVELLDTEDRAGWDLLGSIILSCERLHDWYKEEERGIKGDQRGRGRRR
jgi:hypothetical protein